MSKKGVLIVRPLPEPDVGELHVKPWSRRDKIEAGLVFGFGIGPAVLYVIALIVWAI